MKILDRYILKTFVTTFTTVFIILFFIFILQGIWLFISELAGKDLGFWLVIKFLIFYSPKIVPLVLPLSTLLASIMTFGGFAENYEFAAMKSSGISLRRAMHSLIFFIFGLSIVAFFFANNVIPQAEYKFINMRKNIIQRQPAMAIVEGQFNAIGDDFNIKVDNKSGNNGEKLTGVTIHKRPKGGSTYATIIRSKKGLLKSSETSNILQLELYDGYYYEEIVTTKVSDRNKQPFAKSSFSKQVINIDLTKLNDDSMDDEEVAHTNNMLNINELSYTLDSLQNNYNNETKSVVDNIVQRSNIVLGPVIGAPRYPIKNDTITVVKDSVPENLLSLFAKEDQIKILDLAGNSVTSSEFVITSGRNQLESKIKNINNHWLAFYDKFVIAFACLLMFFIGAPLGAIIRKGGLGLPIVFAVLIFIIFHFINTFGKKLAQENGIPPFVGAWMSSFVLSPLAVLLTYRATNDIGVMINFDWLTVLFRKLFPKQNILKGKDRIIALDTIAIQPDAEWKEMEELSDAALVKIVKNARQFNYSDTYRIKALKILGERNITQEELLARGELYDAQYEKLEEAYNDYKNQTKVVFITYILGIVLSQAYRINVILILVWLITMVIFYISFFKAEGSLEEMGKILNRKLGLGGFAIFIGFPFFIFIYFYEKRNIKEALSEYN